MNRREFNFGMYQGTAFLVMSGVANSQTDKAGIEDNLSMIEIFQDGRLIYALRDRDKENFEVTQMGGNGYSLNDKGYVMIRRYEIHGEHENLEKKIADEYLKLIKKMFNAEVADPVPSGGARSPKVQTVTLGPSVNGPNIGIEVAKFAFEAQPKFAILTVTLWEFLNN